MKETCAAATEAAELSKTVTLHDLGLAAVKRRVFTVSADEPALHAFERMIHVGVSAAAVVTDDDTTTGGGEVVGNLSASDVRGVLPDRYGALTQPLTQYLALVRASSFPVVSYSSPRHHREQHPHHHSEGGGGVSAFTPHSSITRRHRSSNTRSTHPATHSSFSSPPPPPPLFCHRSTTFANAVALLCDGRLHHVFVAEDCGGDAAVADAAMAGRALRGKLATRDLIGVLTLTDVLRRVCFEDEYIEVVEDDDNDDDE